LLSALSIVATPESANGGLYLGESTDMGWAYGLVNLAAFLSQAMKEMNLQDRNLLPHKYQYISRNWTKLAARQAIDPPIMGT
jgi:hypothetical protein